MDIMDKRLKPCPLCGSDEVVIKIPKGDDGFNIQTYYVRCYACGLTGFKNFHISASDKNIFGSLINYWNTRNEAITYDRRTQEILG